MGATRLPGHRTRTRVLSFICLGWLALSSPPAAVGSGPLTITGQEAAIQSAVWLDTNYNALRDADEVGIGGVQVSLLTCDGRFAASTLTDASGRYEFNTLAPGCYRVRFGEREGHRYCPAGVGIDESRDSDADPVTGVSEEITLGIGEIRRDVDAGLGAVVANMVGDRVWEDIDADGIQDVGEPGIEGARVELLSCNGKPVLDDEGRPMRTISDANGQFVFESMPADCYALAFSAAPGYVVTRQGAGVEALDSDADVRSGRTPGQVLASGAADFNVDAGYYLTATIGDKVWLDANGDGLQDDGEDGVAGVQVLLLDSDGLPTDRVTVTDGFGHYRFTGVVPGNYRVQFVIPDGYRVAPRNAGASEDFDSDPNGLGLTRAFAILSGGQHVDIDLGLRLRGAVAIGLEKLTNGQDADEAPGPLVPTGGTVTWDYIVTNEGDADLFEILVMDDQGVSVTCPGAFLGTGASFTCTGSTDDAQAGQYMNTATVCGNDQTDNPIEVCAEDVSHYFGASPAIAIEKSTNGEDADAPPGPGITVGEAITWTYVVTNTGNVTLTSVLVADDQGLTVTCPSTELDPGVSMTCSATGSATAGQYANVGTASGVPPVGPAEVTASDPSHYFGIDAGLIVEKLTNGEDADTAPGPDVGVGDVVLWEYVVTNVGNVILTDLAVTDDQGVVVSCPTTTINPGASVTCTGTGTATEGPYMNLGTACADVDPETEVCASDPSHYTGIGPSIDIETLTQGEDADTPTGPSIPAGDTVNWSYVVTNTGGTTLTDIVVTDNQGVTVDCPADVLAPGESFTCTASGTAVPGQYANIGEACGSFAGEMVCDTDPSHYFGESPMLQIEKLTNGVDADNAPGPYIAIGDPVTWTYEVTNTGNVRIDSVTVTDNQGVTVNCPGIAFLDPGASATCTASGVATPGQYQNIGEVCADVSGTTVCDTDTSHYFGFDSGLTIDKLTNGEDADTPPGPSITEDDPVTWSYVITNTGNVDVANIAVSDDQGVSVTCPADTLAPGASLTCTGSGVAIVGQYANIGTVSGQPVDENGNPIGDPVGDSDPSHYTGIALEPGAIGDRVFEDSDGDGVQDAGEPGVPGVTVNLWTDDDGDGTPDTIVATTVTDANGNYAFTGVDSRLTYLVQFEAVPDQPFTLANVGDDALDSDADPATGITAPFTVSPGETNNDVDAGILPPAGGVIGDLVFNDANENGIQDPGETGLPGIVVNLWTDDDGDGTPDTVVATTTTDANGNYQFADLDPRAIYLVQFVAAPGTVFTSQDVGGNDALDSDPDPATGITAPIVLTPGEVNNDVDAGLIVLAGGLTIDKLTNGEDADTPPGPSITEDEPVEWTYVITNTGNVDVANISVVDDQGVDVTCPADTLAPGATLTCTGNGVAIVGQYANIGTVSGQPVDENGNPIGDPVGDSDPSHYTGIALEPGAIGDRVFEDSDGDGVQDAGEPGVSGVTVNLWTDDDGDGTPDTIVATTVTDANGNYAFTGVDSRLTYLVQFEAVPDQPFTLANVGDDALDSDPDPATGITAPFTVSPGETNNDVDAGILPPAGGVIGDLVFNDANENGIQDPGETGLPGIVVNLWTDDDGDGTPDTVVATTTTDANGNYQFADLDPRAIYLVQFVAAPGTVFTSQDVGGNDALDSDPDPATGITAPIVLTPGEVNNDVDAGLIVLAGGLTIDKRTNGEDAATPPGPQLTVGDAVTWTYLVSNIGNVTVENIVVSDDQGVAVSCPADSLAPGASFTCSGSGTATLGQYVNVGTVTGQGVDGNGNPVGDPLSANDTSHYLGVAPPGAIIGDFVFNDQDGDGVQDPGEPGLPGVAINLWVDQDGNGTPDVIVASTVSDAGGAYQFADLDASLIYLVQFVAAPGQAFAPPDQGGNDALDSDADPATGVTAPIVLTPGETNNTIDAGLILLRGGVAIEKATNGVDADTPTGPSLPVGSPVTWTYTITNTGDLALAGVAVSDDQGVTVSCPGDTLAPGATLVCTASGTVMPGQYRNVGTATAQPVDDGVPVGSPVVASDPSHYFGVVMNDAVIGDRVFRDRNGNGIQDAGEIGMANVTINLWADQDSDGTPDVIVATTTSDADGMYLFSGVAAGDYLMQFIPPPGNRLTLANVGGDDALDSDPDPDTGITDPFTVLPGQSNLTIDAGTIRRKADLRLEKATNGVDADAAPGPTLTVGDTVEWTYTVSNLGDAELESILVSDDQGVSVSCPDVSLAPGESFTCVGTGIVMPGQYMNIGTVSAQPVDGGVPFGSPVIDSDPSHYFGEEDDDCVDGDVADHFNRVAYDNNDGSMDWSDAWKENDPRGGGAASGRVRVRNGKLQLRGYPKREPSIQREVDLSGFAAATLTFDWHTSRRVDKSDAVTLEVSADGGQTWSVLEVYTDIDGHASGSARFDLSPYISPRTLIRFTVTHRYTGRGERFRVDNVRIVKKCDGTPSACIVTPSAGHALWLPDFNGDGHTARFDLDPGAQYVELDDGSAALTGVARRQGDADQAFMIAFAFAGRTVSPPPGSPKNGFGADTSDWYYYPEWSATMAGIDAYAGAQVELSRRGPAYQVGTGANDRPNEQAVYGGSAWFDFDVASQGDACGASGQACLTQHGYGDLNVRIDCP